MTDKEFWTVTQKALAIFNRQKPPKDTLREWFAMFQTMDHAIFSGAVDKLIAGETEFPRNFPRAVKDYAHGLLGDQRQRDQRQREQAEGHRYNEEREPDDPTPREWCERIQKLIGSVGRP